MQVDISYSHTLTVFTTYVSYQMVDYVKLYKHVNCYYLKENVMTGEKYRYHLLFLLMFFHVLQVFRVLPSRLEIHFSILQTVMYSKDHSEILSFRTLSIILVLKTN
jgi:hypothetical protein